MLRSSSSANAADRLELPTRALLYGAGALAVIVGPVLFLFPQHTGSYFAWEIDNPLTPVFMGANYLAGIGAVWGARAGSWSITRVTMPALIAFALTQLLATLLHLDILNWSHPVAWAWLAVYIASPLAAIPVSILQERRWRRASHNESGTASPLRVPLVAASGLCLGVGLALFLVPETVASWWPWALTPLTGRVVGGWVLSGAFLYWMLAREPMPERTRIGTASVVVVMVLLLVGAMIQRDAFDGPSLSLAAYLAYSIVLCVFALTLLVRTGRRR